MASCQALPSVEPPISGNVAFDNGGSGVEIEGGTGNVVSGNTVRGNDIGIRVKDDAAASVTDNTVADNTHYGINVLDSAGAAQVPVSGNTISGSWAAINLESEQSATLSNNNSTDVTTALVVAGVASHDTSWFERISTFLRWNPMLILWVLVLGVPSLVGAARILGVPLRAGRHRALPS
jgi:parallel beta-helix repeat protein